MRHMSPPKPTKQKHTAHSHMAEEAHIVHLSARGMRIKFVLFFFVIILISIVIRQWYRTDLNVLRAHLCVCFCLMCMGLKWKWSKNENYINNNKRELENVCILLIFCCCYLLCCCSFGEFGPNTKTASTALVRCGAVLWLHVVNYAAVIGTWALFLPYTLTSCFIFNEW